jgi:hypothetical protein
MGYYVQRDGIVCLHTSTIGEKGNRSVLAHEIGHHVTSGRDTVDVTELESRKTTAYHKASDLDNEGLSRRGLRPYSLTTHSEFKADTYRCALRGTADQRRRLATLWGVDDLADLFPLQQQ